MAADLTQFAADLTTLRGALASVGSLTTATDAETASIFDPLQLCIADVEAALATDEDVMLNRDGLYVGGVTPGVAGNANALVFLSYLSFAAQAPVLLDMESWLDRMAQNIVAYNAKIPRNCILGEESRG
jgi:hypothetical protein